MTTEIHTTELAPDRVLEALRVRRICQATPWMAGAEAHAQHMGMTYRLALDSSGGDGGVADAALTHERTLLTLGNTYFEQGYRLRHSDPHPWGVPHSVPPTAVSWQVVDRDPTQGRGREDQLAYVVNILDEITTAPEIADELGVAYITVLKAIERNNIPARKSAGTWLIRRADALKRWGKPASTLLLAVGLAVWIAQLPV